MKGQAIFGDLGLDRIIQPKLGFSCGQDETVEHLRPSVRNLETSSPDFMLPLTSSHIDNASPSNILETHRVSL